MESESSVQANIVVVRAALDAINRGDTAGLAATVTSDFVRTDLGQGCLLDHRGTDPLTTFIVMVRRAMPDFAVTIADIVATSDRVVVRLRLTGTHIGYFMGAPPTGREIAINGICMYRLRDGRICENYQLLDMAGLVRELTQTPSMATSR